MTMGRTLCSHWRSPQPLSKTLRTPRRPLVKEALGLVLLRHLVNGFLDVVLTDGLVILRQCINHSQTGTVRPW